MCNCTGDYNWKDLCDVCKEGPQEGNLTQLHPLEYC